MRGVTRTVLLLLSACDSHTGAYITVHADDSSIDTVALYLGDTACTSATGAQCIGLTPKGETASLTVGTGGGAWFRDSDTRFEAPVQGGVAHFHLEATGADATVTAIAIGYAGDPTALDVVASHVIDGLTIPAGDVVDIDTTLDAAMPVVASEDPRTAQPDGNYALVWTSPPASNSQNTPTECVLSEQWSGGRATRTYLVPPEDADCDGQLTFGPDGTTANPLECDPLWFMRTGISSSGPSSCTKNVTVNNANVCMLAGQACTDGSGPTPGSCVRLATTYCLPSDMCAIDCAASTGDLSTCLTSATTGTLPQVQCTLYVDQTGAPCATMSTAATIDFSPLFTGSTRTCNRVRFADASVVGYVAHDTLTLPGETAATFDTSSQNDPCTLSITWHDQPLVATNAPVWLFADILVSNFQHLAVPIEFKRGTCDAAPGGVDFACTTQLTNPVGAVTDPMINCAQ